MNRAVAVVVARPGDERETIELQLTPTKWKGEGALGCTVQVWPEYPSYPQDLQYPGAAASPQPHSVISTGPEIAGFRAPPRAPPLPLRRRNWAHPPYLHLRVPMAHRAAAVEAAA